MSETFFHIEYETASLPTPHAVPSVKSHITVDHNLVENELSIDIIRAKSYCIRRCQKNECFISDQNQKCSFCDSERCCSCQSKYQNPNDLNVFIDDTRPFKYDMLLALLVHPSLTHKFIDTINSYERSMEIIDGCDKKLPSRNKSGMNHIFAEAEFNLRKAIHPCLCDNEHDCNFLSNFYYAATENKNDERSDFVTTRKPHLSIAGILTCDGDNTDNTKRTIFPADVVLFRVEPSLSRMLKDEYKQLPQQSIMKTLSQYSFLLNHESTASAPWSVMKAFPTCSMTAKLNPYNFQGIVMDNSSMALPCCPVCLNRIDPTYLGLPDLKQQHKCSGLCYTSKGSPFTDNDTKDNKNSCINETKLMPWPPPAHCAACQVILQKDMSSENKDFYQCSMSLSIPIESLSSISNPRTIMRSCSMYTSPSLLKCNECGITTTLWVCLTCGTVGCGRYTLKHASKHFTTVGHPFSLELATMRIWDYFGGTFVHRRDLMECPVLSMKWGNHMGSSAVEGPFQSHLISSPLSVGYCPQAENSKDSFQTARGDKESSVGQHYFSSLHNSIEQSPSSCQNLNCEKITQNIDGVKLYSTPKKSIMLSQEYEALLQSALEDQAMHFEGECVRVRTKLASSIMHQVGHISDVESHEIQALKKDAIRLKCELDKISSAFLETQTQENIHRTRFQKLRREKTVANELLQELRKETALEHTSRRQRMDDLSLQIEDLTTNLRMKTRIANVEELNEAQIFCTTGEEREIHRDKKGRRLRLARKK